MERNLEKLKKKFDVYPSEISRQRMEEKTTKEKVVVGENVRGNHENLNQTIEHSKRYTVFDKRDYFNSQGLKKKYKSETLREKLRKTIKVTNKS